MWALIQLVAWCRCGNKPLSEPMMAWFTDAYMRHPDPVGSTKNHLSLSIHCDHPIVSHIRLTNYVISQMHALFFLISFFVHDICAYHQKYSFSTFMIYAKHVANSRLGMYLPTYRSISKTRDVLLYMDIMTSSNGNIFRVTGHLWGESTGDRWIPLTKASNAHLWYFSSVEQTIETLVIWDAIELIMASL